MKHREFVYTGQQIPKLTKSLYNEFYINFQKAIILSLEEQNIITNHQKQYCFERLEEQHKKTRPA